MLIQKAFKFALMPRFNEISKIDRFCGCARYVYNKALDLYTERHKTGQTARFSYYRATGLLTQWKKDEAWLKECHSQVLQQALKDLASAFENYLSLGAGFPKHRKKFHNDSIRYPQGCRLDQEKSRIWLPKIGWVRYRRSREVRGEIKNVIVSRKCGRFYVIIQTEFEECVKVRTGGEIGIDLGVRRFVTCSDGTYYPPLNALKGKLGTLRKAMQAFSRKKKGSNNQKKQVARIRRIYNRIRNARVDYLNKISTEICNSHAYIFIENIRVSNMTKSAHGTAEHPGRNVRQKSALNRCILDQGWYEFRRMLEYKALWMGCQVIAVPSQYTSQICPRCGHVSKDNRRSQADFTCEACGYHENADVVGAVNVLARGRKVCADRRSGGDPAAALVK
jgi:putative transposase